MSADPTTWLTNRGDRIVVFPGSGLLRRRRWYWNCTAANGEVVEQGQGYLWQTDAVIAAERHHPRVSGDES